MLASGKHILMGLTLCAAGIMTAASTIPATAAPAAPTIAVTTHVSTSYLPGSYGQVALHRLTVHITGSNFTPGEKVSLAIVTASPWAVLGKGWIYAQDAVVTRWCEDQHAACFQPNPEAGTIDYYMRFGAVPAATHLLVLYRAAHLTGMHDVTF